MLLLQRLVPDCRGLFLCCPATRTLGPSRNKYWTLLGVLQLLFQDILSGQRVWLKQSRSRSIALATLFRWLIPCPRPPDRPCPSPLPESLRRLRESTSKSHRGRGVRSQSLDRSPEPSGNTVLQAHTHG